MAKRKHQRRGEAKLQAGIERVNGDVDHAIIIVDGDEKKLERYGEIDFWLVKTDDFQPLASKNSVIEVYMDAKETEPGDVALVVDAGRLGLRRIGRGEKSQVLGMVVSVRSWPNMPVENY